VTPTTKSPQRINQKSEKREKATPSTGGTPNQADPGMPGGYRLSPPREKRRQNTKENGRGEGSVAEKNEGQRGGCRLKGKSRRILRGKNELRKRKATGAGKKEVAGVLEGAKIEEKA